MSLDVFVTNRCKECGLEFYSIGIIADICPNCDLNPCKKTHPSKLVRCEYCFVEYCPHHSFFADMHKKKKCSY